MQWKSWRDVLVFIFGPPALLMAGCGPASEVQGPASPYQGVQLRVLCPTAALRAFVQQQGGPWAARQGVELEVEAAGREEDSPADVRIIEAAALPHWASAGRLAELPEAYRRRESPFAWPELLSLYREQLLSWDGRIWGLPVLGESPLCCYRSDWLADPAHQEAFRKQYGHPLTAPTTWLQVAHLAEYFHSHGPGGRPAPSLPPLPSDERALDNLFYALAAGYARPALSGNEASARQRRDEMFAFHYDLKTGKPRLTRPGFVRALSVLERLQKFRPEAAGADPEEAFASGRAVLCLTSAAGLARFQQSAAVRDRVDVCPIPGGEVTFDVDTGAEKQVPEGNRVPYLGGESWLGVVPARSAHAEAAFALLADLSGPTSSGRTALEPRWGGGPLREDQLLRERWDAFDLDAARTRHLQEALQQTLVHRSVKNPVLCLRLPTAAQHRVVLVAELRAALKKGADPERTLADIAKRWSALDEARGLDRVREEYRLSVGLLAR